LNFFSISHLRNKTQHSKRKKHTEQHKTTYNNTKKNKVPRLNGTKHKKTKTKTKTIRPVKIGLCFLRVPCLGARETTIERHTLYFLMYAHRTAVDAADYFGFLKAQF